MRFYDGRPDSQERWREIAGVVGDVRHYRLDAAPPRMSLRAGGATPSTAMVLVVHTSGSPRAMTATIRRQIRELDPELAVFQIATLEELIA